jgi:hypothetical protein
VIAFVVESCEAIQSRNAWLQLGNESFVILVKDACVQLFFFALGLDAGLEPLMAAYPVVPMGDAK